MLVVLGEDLRLDAAAGLGAGSAAHISTSRRCSELVGVWLWYWVKL